MCTCHILCARHCPVLLYHGDSVWGSVPVIGTTGLNIINLEHPGKSEPYGHVSAPSSFSPKRAWKLQQVIWKSV